MMRRVSAVAVAAGLLVACQGAQTGADAQDAPADRAAAEPAQAMTSGEGMSGGMAMGGPAARLAALDANRDGAVSFDEIRTGRERLFARLDVDGNGELSEAEAGERVSPVGGPGGNDLAFLAADADFSGSLSRREFVEAPIPALTRIDADMDGRLTEEEFAEARQRMRSAER